MRIYLIVICNLLFLSAFSQKDTALFKNENVSIYKDSAYFNGKELYNATKDLEILTKKEVTDECKVSYDFYYNPLSLIGNYYSYESGEGGESACGVPSNSLSVQTIDLKTTKAVSLSDLFLEKSILEALKNDTWVKEMELTSKTKIQATTSFDELLDSINRFGYAKFNKNSFTIISYNSKIKKVAVRFVGVAYMGYNHNKHLQLGLWLKPTRAFKRLLKNNTYFTAKKFKNGLLE